MAINDRRPQVDRDEEGKETVDEESTDGKDTQEENTSGDEASTSEKPDGDTEEEITEETEDEKSTEETESESDDVDDSEDNIKKRIQGLQEEEKRVIADVVKARGERREAKSEQREDTFVEKEVDLTGVNPEDQKLIDKVVDAKLKSGGYVKQEDYYKTEANAVKDEWLVKNPEYLPVNDPDDVKWNRLQEELKFYKIPVNPKDYKKILDKAHRELNPSTLPIKSRAGTDAATQKTKSASKGAGGGSTKSQPTSKGKLSGREYMKGYTDKELDELGL